VATFLERDLGVGGDLFSSAVARAAALGRANERCSAVAVALRVRRRPDGVVAFDVPVAVGSSLAEVLADRTLTIGECVSVGVALADALAALHAERLAHGDVAPANVLVSGRAITLVDTMGALGDERGTVGFASPERNSGATPAGDVFALGKVLRAAADGRAAPIIEAWTAQLLDSDPDARPSAAHAARALAMCAPAESIRAPQTPVVSAMRASVTPRTMGRAEDRWWRLQRQAVKVAPAFALAVVAAIAGAGLVPAVAEGLGRGPGSPARTETPAHADTSTRDHESLPVGAAALTGPTQAAEDLTRRRTQALAEGDARALRAVTLPGSPAAVGDAETAAALESGALRFQGLLLEDVSAELVATTPGGAIVAVTSEFSGYSVGPTSVPAGRVDARVELRLTQTGWFVERILPQP